MVTTKVHELVHPQLTLPLDTAPATSFASFHLCDANTVAHRTVKAFIGGVSAERQIFLWGEAGSGKSHLLSAACQAVSGQGYRIAYLPASLAAYPDALSGLEQCELVCIDDVHKLEASSEMQLCHCIERCRAASTMLLFAADRPPEALALSTPALLALLDLGPRFRVGALQGDALREALRQEARHRSLALGEDVIDYLLKHFPPTMAALRPVIDRLDTVSLSEKRRLTIPLVRQIFGNVAAAC